MYYGDEVCCSIWSPQIDAKYSISYGNGLVKAKPGYYGGGATSTERQRGFGCVPICRDEADYKEYVHRNSQSGLIGISRTESALQTMGKIKTTFPAHPVNQAFLYGKKIH